MKLDVKKIEKVLLIIMIIFIYVFNYQEGFGNTFANLMIILFCVFEIFMMRKKNKIKISSEIVSFLIFECFCLFSCLYSEYQNDSLVKVKTLAILMVLLFCLYNYVTDKSKYINFLKILCIATIISSIYIIFNSNWYLGNRVSDIIGDSNLVAAYLNYGSVILMYCISEKIINKKFGYIGLIIIAFTILISGSRSGLVLFLIGIFMSFKMYSNKKITLKKILTICFIPFLFIIIYNLIMNNEILYNIIGNRFVSFVEIMSGKHSSINETSTQTRFLMLSLAWDRFFQTPFSILLGKGIGTFAPYFLNKGGWYAFCHNNYLELLNGVGIIGTFFWYFPIFKILVSLIKDNLCTKRKDSAMGIILILEMVIINMFIVFYYQKCEFLFLFLIIYLYNYLRNDKNAINTKDILKNDKE